MQTPPQEAKQKRPKRTCLEAWIKMCMSSRRREAASSSSLLLHLRQRRSSSSRSRQQL